MNRRQFLTTTAAATGIASLGLTGCGGGDYDFELLNASYDPTRELYRKINRMFADHCLADPKISKLVRVRMSLGGSGIQARAVGDGLPADVATLALGNDIESLRRK